MVGIDLKTFNIHTHAAQVTSKCCTQGRNNNSVHSLGTLQEPSLNQNLFNRFKNSANTTFLGHVLNFMYPARANGTNPSTSWMFYLQRAAAIHLCVRFSFYLCLTMMETSSFNNAASSMKHKIFWAKILAEILSDYSTREHTLTKLVRTAECVKMPAGEIKLIL